MQYIKVRWLHDDPDEPVLLYSELDSKKVPCGCSL